MLADTPMELSEKWRLRPGSHRTLLVFSEALICLSYTAVIARLRVTKNLAERQGLEPRTPLLVRLFSRQRPRPTGRAPFFAIGSPAWTRTMTSRLTDGHAALTSPGNGPSARFRAAVFRLSGGCSAIELRRMVEKWSRAPVLPRVPPRSKRGGFADSLARDI